MSYLTAGDHVRLKSTGEVMVVEGRTDSGSLLLSKWGHMAGSVVIHPERIPVAETDVVKVVASVEWVDADE
jgi:uncharacterized protein YodC (DUF2158 family)